MRVSRRGIAVACIFLSQFWVGRVAAGQVLAGQSDQAAAEAILGPQWREFSRRAGMIFAGTVLKAPEVATVAIALTGQTASTARAAELTFRVDEAIAGVEPGQTLTIREWAGALAMHRRMRAGERVLIFLYPPSRLGLTSPVGGSAGQIELDLSGDYISGSAAGGGGLFARDKSRSQTRGPLDLGSKSGRINAGSISVAQLKRAIRSARQE